MYAPELIDEAVEILFFLEAIDWRWDIKTILEQPEELTHLVMHLKAQGVSIEKKKPKK